MKLEFETSKTRINTFYKRPRFRLGLRLGLGPNGAHRGLQLPGGPSPQSLSLDHCLMLALPVKGLGVPALLGQGQLRDAHEGHTHVLHLVSENSTLASQVIMVSDVGLRSFHTDQVGGVRLHGEDLLGIQSASTTRKSNLASALRLPPAVMVDGVGQLLDHPTDILVLNLRRRLLDTRAQRSLGGTDVELGGFIQQELIDPLDGLVLGLEVCLEIAHSISARR
mmetsp:Transcript_23073/g.50788  ORF Transcript_23073/g.50788 Transcript_23073/m.50788 type:complete len:223 (-) Transcript_23073:1130-1798(-)